MDNEAVTAVVAAPAKRVGMLRPVETPENVIAVQEETRNLIEKALVKDRDYGTIKGTARPALFKAGAERVILAFGCYPVFKIVREEVDHNFENRYTDKWGKDRISFGLYRYVVECEIVHRESGMTVAQFVGSCSTLESKYISRPRDSENTVLKMAEKRALVGVALTGFGLSDQFTQDVEDMPREMTSESELKEGRSVAQEEAALTVLTFESLVDFGKKHKGQPLSEVPDGYLSWMLEPNRRLGLHTDRWVELAKLLLEKRELEAEEKRVTDAQASEENGTAPTGEEIAGAIDYKCKVCKDTGGITDTPLGSAPCNACELGDPKADYPRDGGGEPEPDSVLGMAQRIGEIVKDPRNKGLIEPKVLVEWRRDAVNRFKKMPIAEWLKLFEGVVQDRMLRCSSDGVVYLDPVYPPEGETMPAEIADGDDDLPF